MQERRQGSEIGKAKCKKEGKHWGRGGENFREKERKIRVGWERWKTGDRKQLNLADAACGSALFLFPAELRSYVILDVASSRPPAATVLATKNFLVFNV